MEGYSVILDPSLASLFMGEAKVVSMNERSSLVVFEHEEGSFLADHVRRSLGMAVVELGKDRDI